MEPDSDLISAAPIALDTRSDSPTAATFNDVAATQGVPSVRKVERLVDSQSGTRRNAAPARRWNRRPQITAECIDVNGIRLRGKWIKHQIQFMELPVLALTTDRGIFRWESTDGSMWVEVIPSALGSATIDDGDILVFIVSKLLEAGARGIPISRVVEFSESECLRAIEGGTGGAAHALLKRRLARLAGTRIRTSEMAGGIRFRDNFGIVERIQDASRGRDARVRVTISEWTAEAIQSREVLGIGDSAYFKLAPLEKRLFQLLRKHLGNKKHWSVRMGTLYKKSGSSAPPSKFTTMLREIVVCNRIPMLMLTCDFAVPWDARTLLVTRRVDVRDTGNPGANTGKPGTAILEVQAPNTGNAGTE